MSSLCRRMPKTIMYRSMLNYIIKPSVFQKRQLSARYMMSQKMNNFDNTGAETVKENDGDNGDNAVDLGGCAGEVIYDNNGSGEFPEESNITNGNVCQLLPGDRDNSGKDIYQFPDEL